MVARIVDKAKLIELRAEGKKNAEIALIFKCSERTVENWVYVLGIGKGKSKKWARQAPRYSPYKCEVCKVRLRFKNRDSRPAAMKFRRCALHWPESRPLVMK